MTDFISNPMLCNLTNMAVGKDDGLLSFLWTIIMASYSRGVSSCQSHEIND
ncbi:uncharacterized protein LACBIDRAFT_315477 [Laccaria bicolor S238N-H82]|uniref:Predicted protein n=1 Tax=Laccaria bicolor (strain S238N-H82 / ATCC MYA-4686) TaxID=486041 RepID=B0D2H3_LACBS|nr:uncharacterized protein LACBIDRAFT_315477 [Laccaria bicolor S238N-H82]EDR10749.1 predicted protein [Laccaria bicolor S238N-H82]|eukprot:XP_001878050.1 predicted protein [Laccaria bicolor S238N-H82]